MSTSGGYHDSCGEASSQKPLIYIDNPDVLNTHYTGLLPSIFKHFLVMLITVTKVME